MKESTYDCYPRKATFPYSHEGNCGEKSNDVASSSSRVYDYYDLHPVTVLLVDALPNCYGASYYYLTSYSSRLKASVTCRDFALVVAELHGVVGQDHMGMDKETGIPHSRKDGCGKDASPETGDELTDDGALVRRKDLIVATDALLVEELTLAALTSKAILN